VTAAVLERPGSLTERPALDGGATLEELLSASLAEAQANGSTECPVCHARMTYARAGAECGTRAGAECGGCDSRVS
jgi:hypothetical protein